jgi:steroid delta-isomerase-like uncharacterized protein
MTAGPHTQQTEGTMLAEAEANLEGAVTAHNNHDAAAFAACFAPDGIMRVVPTDDVVQGREQVAGFLETYFQAFPDWQVADRGIDPCGECVWVQWTITGTHAGEYQDHAPTHRGFELIGCSRFAFAPDGLIAEEALYFDPATVLRQLGIAEA